MGLQRIIVAKPEDLRDFAKQIERLIPSIFEEVESRFPLPSVEVLIEDNPTATIAETGLGGFSPDANHVYVRINPEKKGLKKNFERELRSTLAHELHHCARWASVGYGTTLLEAMVSEGLADHFDIEVNKSKPKPWSVALSERELRTVREKAEPLFYSAYDESEWFFGSADVPPWAGYSLGFKIVGDYIEQTGSSAGALVGERAEKFIT